MAAPFSHRARCPSRCLDTPVRLTGKLSTRNLTRGPAPLPPPSSSGGAHHHSRGGGAPPPPEADDNILETVVVVGRTWAGDFCHVPVTVEGVACLALVDTGSTVTLVRPDILLGWTVLQPVQLRTVAGERAPMKGKGLLSICVGGKNCPPPSVGSSCAGPLYPRARLPAVHRLPAGPGEGGIWRPRRANSLYCPAKHLLHQAHTDNSPDGPVTRPQPPLPPYKDLPTTLSSRSLAIDPVLFP